MDLFIGVNKPYEFPIVLVSKTVIVTRWFSLVLQNKKLKKVENKNDKHN